MSTRMARPTTASAAATVITISANSWPSRFTSCRAKATSVRLTAFNISSMQMRITSGLRRTRTPIVPSRNRINASSRNQLVSSCSEPTWITPLLIYAAAGFLQIAQHFGVVGPQVAAAQINCADGRNQQQQRRQLERIQISGEQPDGDVFNRAE